MLSCVTSHPSKSLCWTEFVPSSSSERFPVSFNWLCWSFSFSTFSFPFLSSSYLTGSTLPSLVQFSLRFLTVCVPFKNGSCIHFSLSPSLPLNVFWMQMLFPMFLRAFHTNYNMIRRNERESVERNWKKGGNRKGMMGESEAFQSHLSLYAKREERRRKDNSWDFFLLSTLILHSAIFYYQWSTFGRKY